jgi:hypothetical protein
MSVWFKYAGDKDITTGHPGGSSVFTLPVTGGFPPYGTELGSGNEPRTLNWSYTTGGRNGTFEWGYTPYIQRADGVGGSFLDYGTTVKTTYGGYVIDDSEFEAFYRIIYRGYPYDNSWSECHRSGPTGSGNGGDLSIYIYGPNQSYVIGSFSSTEMHDGTCGTYNDTVNTWFPYGTYITTWYDSSSGYTYDYYADGAGGYYDVQQ